MAALGLAGYVAVRDPSPETLTGMTPQFSFSPSPAASAPPSPTPLATLPALLLRARSVPVGHVVMAAPDLGWRLTTGFAPPVQAADVAGKEVVVIVAGEGSAAEDERAQAAEDAARTAREVRALAPQARLFLVAPLGVNGRALDEARNVLRTAAAQVSADFIDPVGSRWLQDRPALVSNSSLTPDAAPVLGELVARAVERAFSLGVATRAPSASPSPAPQIGATGTVTPSP